MWLFDWWQKRKFHTVAYRRWSDEKFDDASAAQSLCGIAIKTRSETRLWQVLIFVRAVPFPDCLEKGRCYDNQLSTYPAFRCHCIF